MSRMLAEMEKWETKPNRQITNTLNKLPEA